MRRRPAAAAAASHDRTSGRRRRRLRRLTAVVALLALLLLLVVAGVFLWLRSRGLPKRSGEATLAGLTAPVEVRFDGWGVPHVSARTEADLAAALGYLHANDRFFQMEMGRRAAAGRLAELLGAAALPGDRHFRTLGVRRAAEALLPALGERSRLWVEGYARGVNAWLGERSGDLPPELVLLRAEVEPWTPADSLAFNFLFANTLSFLQGRPEETRFLWLRHLGLEKTRDLLGEPDLHVPEAILAAAAGDGGEGLPDPRSDVGIGSNNWAVGGSRTASGRPLVANDPHLPPELPATWYEVHLRCPQLEVAGMTLPGAPVVVFGHSRRLAWAVTNTMLDDHDLFFEVLDPSGERVRRDGGWVPLTSAEELIRVRGGGVETLVVKSTDRGPLLAADEEQGLPPRSLAWTLHSAGDPFAPFLALARAAGVEEVRGALGGFVGPALNLVVADAGGGLFSTVLGRVPARRRGDGRLPAPGWDASYGWHGLRPQDENPSILAPDDDLLATANNDIRPPGYALSLSADFDSPHRAERIRQALEEHDAWTAEGLAGLQNDRLSLYAKQLVALLDGEYEGTAARAWEVLAAWDGEMGPRGPAALFAVAQFQLRQLIFNDEKRAAGLRWGFSSNERLFRVLEGAMDPAWFDDVTTPETEDRHQILSSALAQAWDWGVRRWGSDVAAWEYAGLHSLDLGHPLGSVPLLGRWLNRGPYPASGSDTTIAAFGGGVLLGDRMPVFFAPSARWVADLAAPDRSRAMLPGGQSGHPSDRHYDDQLQPFLAGESRPVPWSERAVREATVSVLELRPE